MKKLIVALITIITLDLFSDLFSNNKRASNTSTSYDIKVLKGLPQNYNVEMAVRNDDVVTTTFGQVYNLAIFNNFLRNSEKGIKSSVVITRYSIEGIAYPGILEFTGDYYVYTVDRSRLPFLSSDEEVTSLSFKKINIEEYKKFDHPFKAYRSDTGYTLFAYDTLSDARSL